MTKSEEVLKELDSISNRIRIALFDAYILGIKDGTSKTAKATIEKIKEESAADIMRWLVSQADYEDVAE